jgi:L-lysine exporter family protein LysE/ArgO
MGAMGFGALVRRFPAVTAIAAWGGAAFLLYHGARALLSAIRPGALVAGGGDDRFPTTTAAIGATLAISLLNPHVYLDTVVLLGSVAAQYPPTVRVWFAAGAIGASVTWFSALGFGARVLAPVFRSRIAWRVLDFLIAAIMVSIAVSLVVGQLG